MGLPRGDYYGRRYAPAKIRVRKGIYRYLVWRDGEQKREFYLGKVRESTPENARARADLVQARAGAGVDVAGVKRA